MPKNITFFNIEAPGPDCWPFQRQTEDGLGGHGAVQFHFDGRPDAEWLVAFSDVPVDIRTRIPRAHRILVVTEPPSIRTYTALYSNQFGVLISPLPISGFRGRWVCSHGGLPWLYGASTSRGQGKAPMDFNTLKRRAIPEPKLGRLSVVTSNKTKLSRHRARVALVRHLQKEIPHQLDVFGHGFKLVDDKADAIDGYRYHLVIENNTIPDFWTEKLADSYLGYSLPLYSGCPNVTKYFPDDSLILLGDITDHGGVTRQIRRILEDDPWSRRLSSILEARHLLLNRHNLFSILARVISSDTTQQSKLSVTETILPFERQFRGPIGKLRHLVNRAQVLAARR